MAMGALPAIQRADTAGQKPVPTIGAPAATATGAMASGVDDRPCHSVLPGFDFRLGSQHDPRGIRGRPLVAEGREGRQQV